MSYTKKLVTWISKTTQQFRSNINPGGQSQDCPPDKDESSQTGVSSANSPLAAVEEPTSSGFQRVLGFFGKFKKPSDKAQQAAANSGFFDNLNQKYLKLPQPFARLLKPLFILSCLVAVYALLGFYAVPAILKAKLPAIIHEETGRKASVAKIEFNPFKLFASIQGFKILEKNSKPFVDFDNLSVKVNTFQSIKQLALVIDEISLKKPTVHLAKDNKGKFNFEDMAKPKKKEEPKKKDDGKLFPMNLAKLSVTDGKLFWNDNHFAKPVSEEISPINLNISDLSTKEKTKAKLDFNLGLKSGGKLDWKANVGINPVASDGTIKLDKVQLQKVVALALSDTAPFDLQGNELFNVDYTVGFDKKDIKVNIKKTRFELQNLQFADKTPNKNQVKTPSFAFEADCAVTLGKDKLDVIVNKAKLDSHDLSYANQMPDPMTVVIPAFSHETDIKVTKGKEGTNIVANKATISLKNIQFTGLKDSKVEVKLPELALETAYQLGLTDKALEAIVTKGKFDLHNLQVAEKGEPKTLIKVPAFGLNGIGVNLKNQEVVIESVTGKDADVQAWLNPDGTINYQALFSTPEKSQPKKTTPTRPNYKTAKTVTFTETSAYEKDKKDAVATSAQVPAPAPIASTPPTAKKDWLIKVNKLDLANFGLTFEDKTLKKPVVMAIMPINLKLSNIVSKLDSKLPVQLEIGINKTGLIKLKGETVISPLVAKIDVDVKNIELDTFQPYVDKFAKVEIVDGNFNIKGQLTVKQPPDKPLDIVFKGNTNVAKLVTRDKILNKDLIKWKNLAFENLNVDVLANSYSATTLAIEKPYARVTIRKDKTVNFSDLVINNQAASTNPAKPVKPVKVAQSKPDASTKPIFKIDKVKIIDGSSDFSDLSLILPFAAQIKSLDGGASGISSEKKSTIKVELKGNAYDLAPVDINGEISPYLGNYDVSLKFDGMPMPLVTPYMVQFAGYKIEKGKLTLGLKYQVENHKLNASNNILIDQLELGEKVENPNAVSLPLELAIVLLKDSDGKIKLDVPLTGSLEDPQFSIGHIIVDALVNVLTKIVTSPFHALASLAGSDEDLSNVAFKPGEVALADKEKTKLDGVAKALKEKPALNIEIKGAAFEEQDWPALQDDALFDQLKQRKADQLSKKEGKKVRAEYVELNDDDFKDMLADAFIEKFPSMAEKSIFGTPKLIAADAGDFYQVAKQKMEASIKPDPERLKHLADGRGQAIAKYLVQKAGIPNERVFILDSALDPKRDGKDVVSALSLKAN